MKLNLKNYCKDLQILLKFGKIYRRIFEPIKSAYPLFRKITHFSYRKMQAIHVSPLSKNKNKKTVDLHTSLFRYTYVYLPTPRSKDDSSYKVNYCFPVSTNRLHICHMDTFNLPIQHSITSSIAKGVLRIPVQIVQLV